MAEYPEGAQVTYTCGDTPVPATIAKKVISGDLEAQILLPGATAPIVVDIRCLASPGGFAAAVVNDDVYLHDPANGLTWHGNVRAIQDGRATIRLDGLDEQTLVAPLSRLTQGIRTRPR